MSLYDRDGHLHDLTDADLVRGNVLRMTRDGVWSSFSDFIIVDVYFVDEQGRRENFPVNPLHNRKQVELARPYATVSGANTVSPTVLTGVERIHVPASRIIRDDSPFKLVVLSTGKAMNHTT